MAVQYSTGSASQFPAFIQARNALALAAGLTIEKQTLSGDKLSTVYAGEPEQFLATGWMRSPEEFMRAARAATKQPYSSSCYTVVFSPSRVWPNFYRGKGTALRMTITRELLPRRIWEPHKGITAYEFYEERITCGVKHTYVGTRAALIDTGIIAADAFDGSRHCDFEYCGRRVALWYWDEDERTGITSLSLFPENIAWADAMERAKHKQDFKTANEWRESKLRNLEWDLRTLLCGSACKNGRVYSFPDSVQAEIKRHFSEMRGLIEYCYVNESKDPEWDAITKAEREFSARRAKRDKAFKSFLSHATATAGGASVRKVNDA